MTVGDRSRSTILREDALTTILMGGALLLAVSAAITLVFGLTIRDQSLLWAAVVGTASAGVFLAAGETRFRMVAGKTRATERRRASAPSGLLRRVLAELRPHALSIAGLLGLALLATPLLLLGPLPLKLAVDSVIGSEPLPGFIAAVVPDSLATTELRLLLFVVILQIAVVLMGQAQELATYVMQTHVGERLTLGIRARLLGHAQRLSLSFHDTAGTASSIYRLQYDAPSFQHIVDSAIPFVSSAMMLIAALYVILLINMKLALVALAVSPFLLMLSRGYMHRVRTKYVRLKELESDALGVVQEVLTAVRVVKAFGREEAERKRFVTRSSEVVRQQVHLSFAEGAFALLINLATGVGVATVMFIGVSDVIAGELTLGELLLVFGYLTQLYGPLQSISQKVGDLQSSLAGAGRVFELLDRVPDVEERPDARPLKRAAGRLELAGVSFGYEPDRKILEDVSLTVEPGMKLGIVGRTGAGKTTLLSLVVRFYDPTAGEIRLDEVDIRDYRLSDLRNQFSIVLQEPVLLSTTIAENIAYARPDAQFDEIVEAADAAGAHQFVSALPDGYDTVVGERGMLLSGGERQRIALARAFLKDAPLVILDEPTSSVDTATEAEIMQTMSRLIEGRTTLMIAHRLSTLRDCDAWVEIDDGRLRFVEKKKEQVG